MNINQKAERVYELASQFGFDVRRSSESMLVIQKPNRIDPIAIQLIDAEPVDGTIRIKRGTVVDLHKVAVEFKVLGLLSFMSELGDFYITSTDNLLHNTYLIPADQFAGERASFRAEDDNNHLDKDNVYEIDPMFHPLLEILSAQKGEFRGIKNHPSISYYIANRSKNKDLKSRGIMAESM